MSPCRNIWIIVCLSLLPIALFCLFILASFTPRIFYETTSSAMETMGLKGPFSRAQYKNASFLIDALKPEIIKRMVQIGSEVINNDIKEKSDDEECSVKERDARRNRTAFTLHNILKTNAHAQYGPITFVTQLSYTRLHMLQRIVTTWDGPISATIYIHRPNVLRLMSKLATFPYIAKLQLHVVIDPSSNVHYPINYLRNVALGNVRTSLVFLCDVDLIPCNDLVYMAQQSPTYVDMLRHGKQVLVVPAFETQQRLLYPVNKADLLRQMDRNIINIFHESFKRGHGPTDYKKWRTSSQPYQVSYRSEYEPYIIMRRDETPKYNERFIGRAMNKASHILHLAKFRFRFIVLPDVFTIHYPHATQTSSAEDKRCGRQEWYKFKRQLEFLDIERKIDGSTDISPKEPTL